MQASCREGNREICSLLNSCCKNANPASLPSKLHSLLAIVRMQSGEDLQEVTLLSIISRIDNSLFGKVNAI
jgi:hypothetical protein